MFRLQIGSKDVDDVDVDVVDVDVEDVVDVKKCTWHRHQPTLSDF